MVAYFLGELPAEEQARLEEACFNDEQFAEFVFTVESELIDEYARGGLTATERQHFEQNYLTSDLRVARVEFALHLRCQFSPAPQTVQAGRRWWQTLFAFGGPFRLQWVAAALAVLLGGWAVRWLLFNQTPVPDPTIITQVTPTPMLDVTPSVSPAVSPSPVGTINVRPVFATITLLAGNSRNPGQPRPVLKLPANATAAELRLRPDDKTYPRYRAELRTREGILWRADNLKPQSGPDAEAAILARVPAEKLKDGDYTLLLYGRDKEGEAAPSDYGFRVTRN